MTRDISTESSKKRSFKPRKKITNADVGFLVRDSGYRAPINNIPRELFHTEVSQARELAACPYETITVNIVPDYYYYETR